MKGLFSQIIIADALPVPEAAFPTALLVLFIFVLVFVFIGTKSLRAILRKKADKHDYNQFN